MKKIGEIKGITLIALSVTIIVLLVLTGIVISSLKGENGLISKTKLAKEKYAISEAKEKLELKITELRVEEGNGETLTKEDLPKLNNDEIDVGSVENFPVEVIYEKYKFNVDENFIVTYIGEADGTIITYTTDPEGYTNQDEVKILIKVSNPKGIKLIKYPNEYTINANGKICIAIDYTVTANGTYTFKIIDQDNKEIVKDVVIYNIDKLKPNNIEIKEKDISLTCFRIETNATDARADEINSSSGIGKYEYYIKSQNEGNYIKYESSDSYYNFTELTSNLTYSVYVRAFDKAENYIDSNIINVKTLTKPVAPAAKLTFNEEHAKTQPLEYPIITSEGIANCELVPNVGEKVTIEITSEKPDDLIYYYSFDSGSTWNEYITSVDINYVENQEIMVKAVYKENISIESTTRIIRKYKKDLTKQCTSSYALKNEAYDGDWESYTELNYMGYLMVDESAIGMNIKAKWLETDNTRTINGFTSTTYSYWDLLWWIIPTNGNGINEDTATILEGTKSIICYTNTPRNYYDYLYEIELCTQE